MIAGRTATERSGRLIGSDDGRPRVHEGRAPATIVLHGFGGTPSEVAPLVEAFAAEGYATHAPLLPGHGTRPEKLQDATFDEWVFIAESLVREAAEKYGRVVLCGFSLGSLVAMEVAARRPGGLVGLVALGNAITLAPPLAAAFALFENRRWELPDWYLVKFWPADVRDKARRARIATYDRNPLRASREVYRAGVRVREHLASIEVPVFLAHGARDRVCPSSNVDLVRRGLGSPRVEARIYPNSAHLVACDLDHEAVARDVLGFVRSLE